MTISYRTTPTDHRSEAISTSPVLRRSGEEYWELQNRLVVNFRVIDKALAIRKGFTLREIGPVDNYQLIDSLTHLPDLNYRQSSTLFFSLAEAVAFLNRLSDRVSQVQ